MNENEVQVWTTEWPTEPGWYWFAGYKWEDTEPSIGAVRVVKTANGVARTIDGAFMWKSEGHRGVFTKATMPPIEKSFIDQMIGEE